MMRTPDGHGRHGWTDIAFLTSQQYDEELAKRKAQKKPTPSTPQP